MKKALTPKEYFALNVSERLDALEAKIDAASHRASVNIKLDLLEVEIMLESVEATDRKYPQASKSEATE